MKKLIALILSLMLILSATGALADAVAWSAESREVVLTLDENPSTGFQWIMSPLGRQMFLSLLGDETSTSDPDMDGAPGEHRWSFQLTGSGEETLYFTYERPFEENNAIRVIAVTFKVDAETGFFSYTLADSGVLSDLIDVTTLVD